MIPYADSIQGVLFPKSGSSAGDATDLWSTVHPGTTPDAFQRPNPNPTLRSVASGRVGELTHNLSVQVGRIDVTLSLNPTKPSDFSSGPPRIEDVSAAISLLSNQMKRVISAVECVRLAIVLDLGKTVAAGEEGSVFREELADLNLPEKGRDYLFQLNVPLNPTSDEQVRLNRLCTWSVGQVGYLAVGPIPQSGPMVMSPFVGCKIDINTPGDVQLEPSQGSIIIDHIADESRLIYEFGYKRLIAN